MCSAATASLFHSDPEFRPSLWSALAGLILWGVLATGADTGRGSGGALVVISVAISQSVCLGCMQREGLEGHIVPCKSLWWGKRHVQKNFSRDNARRNLLIWSALACSFTYVCHMDCIRIIVHMGNRVGLFCISFTSGSYVPEAVDRSRIRCGLNPSIPFFLSLTMYVRNCLCCFNSKLFEIIS